ncbi:MAG: hemolysin family protein [Parvularculaceae bacterium]
MEIAILLILIAANGLFAMSEMALVSSKPALLKARAEKGDKGAQAALKLLEDPSRLLSAVQIGITLIGIVAGAYGATAIADDLAPHVARFAPLAPYDREIAFVLVISLTTYLSRVGGELVPKRIALAAPETIAGIAARPMRFLAALLFPAVSLLRLSTNAVLTLLRVPQSARNVTEDEIRAVIREGASTGLLGREEHEMMDAAMSLGDRDVRSIMTPRFDIVSMRADEPAEQILKKISASGHSRYPVTREDSDDVVGIVQTKELLTRLASDGRLDVAAAMRKARFVPDSLSVLGLLEALSSSEVRMAVVLDEHGALEGLVTAADILGAVAGAKAFSPRDGLQPAVQREDGSWIIDGITPIEDFERLVGVNELGEDDGAYATVAGLVIAELQRLPHVGDRVKKGLYEFEVVDMDGRRIDKLLVRAVPETAAEPLAAL